MATNITIEDMDSYVNEPVQESKPRTPKKTNYDPKNYLNVNLDFKNGEYERDIRIRILPIDKDHGVPFKKVPMHNTKVPVDVAPSGFKSFICLEKEAEIDHERFGDKCPFCEMRKIAYDKSQMLSLSEEERAMWKQVSLSCIPHDVCIVRCIERGHEEDGPKFWRFNIGSQGKDPYSLLMKLYNTRLNESREEGDGDLNIFDIYEGKDIIINVKAQQENGKYVNKKTITITDYGKAKPASPDPDKIEEWVNDPKKWTDCFTPKPYGYLSVLLEGGTPWYDKATETWIAKKSKDEMKSESEKEHDVHDENDLPY